ncbi:MAG: ABC transporter permease, partial [Actinobacteria bacterium]|nr:ABC transporter permease [Actinomycetota bacterium]
SWLQQFAKHNPVSTVSNSLRGLLHVDPTLTAADTRSALIQSAAWIVGILLVMVPLSIARYRRITKG